MTAGGRCGSGCLLQPATSLGQPGTAKRPCPMVGAVAGCHVTRRTGEGTELESIDLTNQ